MRSIFFFLAFALAFSSAFDCGVYTVRDTETYERAKQCSSFSTLSVSWRSNVTLDLEFENVTYISNTLDLTTNINVTSVSFPNLETIGVTFSVSNNVGLKDISLPQARSNSATFTVNNNVDLESFTMAGGIATSVQLTNNNGTNQRFHFTDLNYVKGSLALVANEAVSFQIDNLVSVTADFTIGNNLNLVDLVVSSNSTEQGTSVLGSFSLATSPLTGNVVLPFTLLTIVNVAEIESVVLSLPQLVTLRGTLTVLQCDNLVQVSLPLFTSSLNAGFSVRDLPKLNLFNAPGPFQVANGIEFLRVGSMSSPSTITLGLQSTLTGSLTVSNCYLSSVQLSELSYVAKDIIFSNNVVTGTISISGSPVAVYGRVNFIYNAVGVAIYAPALQVLSEELVVASNYPLNPTTGYAVNFGGLSKVFTFLTVQNNTGINAIDLSSLVLVGGYFDNPTPYAPQTDFNIEFNTFVSGATIDCPQNSTVFGKFTFQNNTNDGSLTASFGFVKIGGDLVVSNSQFDSLHFDSLQCASKITFSGNSGGLATFNSLSQLSNSIIANTDNNNNFTVRGVAPPSGQSQTSPCVACTSDVEEGCSADFKVSQWTSSCGICTASLHSVSSPNPPTQANAPFQFPTLTGPDTPTDSSETSQAPENSAVEQSTAVVQTQKTNAAIGSSSTLIVSSVVLIASFLFVF